MAQYLKSFKLTLTGSAQPITSSRVLTEAFAVRADTNNSGNVYIGDSTVTSDGMYIKPDESNVKEARTNSRAMVEEFNLNKVYVLGTLGDFIRVEYLIKE